MTSAWAKRGLVAALAALAVTACGTEPDPSLDEGPAPAHEPEMFRQVLRYLTDGAHLPEDGDWPEDFGDANYYGPAFFLGYGAEGNRKQTALGDENSEHNSRLIDEALRNISIFTTRLEELQMAALGLIEAQRHRPSEEDRQRLDRFLDVLLPLAAAFDYYPSAGAGGSFAIATYGPATMNAALALLDLEYAHTVGGPQKERRVQEGLEVLAAGRERGFDEALGFYRFVPDSDDLYLYPNAMQILAHVRAYQLTEDTTYLDRARALHQAIQPLKVAGEGRYRSPYSATVMGAKTDDYSTLSAQNYAMLALSLLYEVTGDQAYKQEVLAILAFIRTHLLSGGRVLHHWIDGQIARPTDASYYCSGCNLQLLYIIWRAETSLR